MNVGSEFREIAHCGCQITFTRETTDEGRFWQFKVSGNRPNAAAFYAIYALQGIPVADLPIGGVGSPWRSAPVRGCIPVFIASDSEANFGFKCPRCQQYWRARGNTNFCPYCRFRGQRYELLTDAQRGYVEAYCKKLTQAFLAEEDGDHVIEGSPHDLYEIVR
jgi:hypothetical protein